jgi:dTDP-glucose 4,6-dehydratase
MSGADHKMMKKLLVTGGCGFIGSNFIRYWLKKYPQDSIVNLDKLTYAGHIESTSDFSDDPNYKFVQGDICDPDVVEDVMNGTDYVVHFAAETHVDRSIIGPKTFINTNVDGTQVLLDSALKHNVKKFHHISTDEVFGELELGSKEKFNDKTNYNPRSPYSASKASSDHLVRAYYYTYGLPITITNCSNNFGPYQDPEKFISRMITNLIDGENVKIYGDGKYVRDWLYVEDHVRAIETVLDKGKSGETYLVGGLTEDIDNLEIAKKVVKIFGKDDSSIEFVKDRAGHDRRYAVDWSKINKELSWKPEHGFDEWLVKTIDWYKENEWWWRSLKQNAEELYKKTGQI